jgi:hypothetical protein
MQNMARIISADIGPQLPIRRKSQLLLLSVPMLLLVVGLVYINYFFDDLIVLWTYSLTTDHEGALAHMNRRIGTVFIAMALLLGAVLINRFYLLSYILVASLVGTGLIYDLGHRIMLDRSQLHGLDQFRIYYLFMIGNVGNILRVCFFVALGYCAYTTLKHTNGGAP